MNPRFEEYVAARRQAVDEALERFLPRPPACPPIVSEAMRYSVFAGGKRFRPLLTLAAADAVAAHPDVVAAHGSRSTADILALALPAGCAVEMIHTYSLIHDDLPAMDDDTMRRGRPTLHVVHGEGMAILAGDALHTEAFALLAREPAGSGDLAPRKLRTIETLAVAAGVAGMVGGQAIDLQATGTAKAPKTTRLAEQAALDTLEQMHACKTGALIRATSVAGAIMAGGTEALIGAVDEYATQLGLAFQIVDDILDVEGSAEDLGKTVGKDAAAGKLTFPALVGVEGSRVRARACAARAHAILAAAGLAGYLDDIVEWVVGRTK
ncbi:MAG: polyprenyl synthetase family protein [Bacteroidales bacterium]